MATIVAATGSAGNWTSGSAWVGGVAPTAADDAQITTLTTSITIDSGAVCRSADFTGFTGTATHNAGATLNIGDATAGLTNIALTLVAGMTYTLSDPNTSAITFKSTSSTQQTIATGGNIVGNIVINGSGSSYILSDNLTSSGNFTYTAGTTFNTATNSAIITLNGTNSTFTGGAKTYFDVELIGDGNATIAGINTFTTLNRTGTAVKTDTLILNAAQTVTGTLTFAGNSTTNRLLVKTDTVGTSRVITKTGATINASYVDTRDINMSGGSTVNWAAITGLSGNCGGNSGITFTSGVPQFWFHNSGNWSDATKWFTATNGGGSAGRVPLPQDNVTFDANSFNTGSQTVTQDMPRMGQTITWLNATNSPTWDCTGTPQTMYAALTLNASMTFSGSNSFIWESISRNANGLLMTSAGHTFSADSTIATVNMIWSIQDSFNLTGTLTLTAGNITTNGNSMSLEALICVSNPNSKSIVPSTSTISLNGSSGTLWDATNLSYTGSFSLGGSLISITDTSANNKIFAGVTTNTYDRISIAGGGAGATNSVTFTGTNSFFNFPQVTGGAKVLIYPASTTTSFRAATNFGNGTNFVTVNSSISTTAATFAILSGRANCDYLDLKDNTATTTIPAYAGYNSINSGNNTNWVFTATPNSGSNLMMLGVG